MSTEIAFLISDDSHGGFKAPGGSLFTQAESIDGLQGALREPARCCCSDDAKRLAVIRRGVCRRVLAA